VLFLSDLGKNANIAAALRVICRRPVVMKEKAGNSGNRASQVMRGVIANFKNQIKITGLGGIAYSSLRPESLNFDNALPLLN
jgi:hypothetical protein